MPSDGVVSLIQGLFRESPSLLTSLFWLAVIWAVFLAGVPGSWPGRNMCWSSRLGFRLSARAPANRRRLSKLEPRAESRKAESRSLRPTLTAANAVCCGTFYPRLLYNPLRGHTMTKKTRYFLTGSAAVLAGGLCTGLVAYYGGGFQSLVASTGPTELVLRAGQRQSGCLRQCPEHHGFRAPEAVQGVGADADGRGCAAGVPRGDWHRHRERHRLRRRSGQCDPGRGERPSERRDRRARPVRHREARRLWRASMAHRSRNTKESGC